MTSTDGLQVVYARWRNRQPPRGLLQIAHGMGEHIGRYQVLIEETSARRTGFTGRIIAGTAEQLDRQKSWEN